MFGLEDVFFPPVLMRYKKQKKTFKHRLKTYLIKNPHEIKEPIAFLARLGDLIVAKIAEYVATYNVKVNFVFLAEYRKSVCDTDNFHETNFKTENEIIYQTTDLNAFYKSVQQKLLAEMEDFETKGSGWTLNKIKSLELRINRYLLLRGSSYIELPLGIKCKNAVLNVENEDQKCFLWSILAALHHSTILDKAERVSHYEPFEHEFDQALTGIEFPVQLSDVERFAKRTDMSINVYAYDEGWVVYPLLVTKQEKPRHVDLLYVKDGKNTHYCWIKNLNRLVRSQLTKNHHKIWLCKRCLLHFGTETLIKKHKEDCNEHKPVKIVMPEPETFIRFKDFNRSMKVSFVAYADFECLLRPISTCEPPPYLIKEAKDGKLSYSEDIKKSYTNRYQAQEAISFCLYIVYADGDYKPPIIYFGEDAAKVFIQTLEEEAVHIKELYSQPAAIPMIPLNPAEQHIVDTAVNCHICGKPLKKDDCVLDQDHLSGRFRDVAHIC